MRTAPPGEREEEPSRAPAAAPRPVVAAARLLFGPLLIAGSVLAVLHSVVASAAFSPEFNDTMAEWLPNFCFLGRSLATGRIPGWNPHVMGGIPFAADPLHGWMNGPAMALFSILPCGTALRAYIVLQPLLAGLGLFWFLRSEGMSRPAATVGGLAAALPVAGSALVGALWFSGSFAWGCVLLATGSRYLHARTWPPRLGWLAATGLVWGQVAAAHLSHGFVLATMALGFLVAAHLWHEARAGRCSVRRAVGMVALLVVALPAIGMAVFLPRLPFIARSTLGLGYTRLDELSWQLSRGAGGGDAIEILVKDLSVSWPLRFVLSPGLYLGAIPLVLSLAAWSAPGRRHLAVAFGAFGAVGYALSLPRPPPPGSHLHMTAFLDQYSHSPFRMGLALLVAIPVLAALGVEGWRHARSWRRRASILAPGVALWGVLPLALGAARPDLVLLAAAGAAGAAALAASAVRTRLIGLLPVVVALELSVSGVLGHARTVTPTAARRQEQPYAIRPLFPPTRLQQPVDLESYLGVGRGPVVEALQRSPQSGRYVSIDPAAWTIAGYHLRAAPAYWPFLARQQSMLFPGDLEEAQGYNSIQVVRYWEFVRKVDPKSIRYAAAGFVHLPPVARDLLQVNWVVAPRSHPPFPGSAAVAAQGGFALWRLPNPVPRASVLTAWTAVPSADRALAEVASPSFDASGRGVLEAGRDVPAASPTSAPGAGSRRQGGTAVYRWTGPQSSTISVRTPARALVLVRVTYDPDWHARLDGHPVPVLPVDYVDLGVVVPPGTHTIELAYEDPWIGWGLAGSALALVALAALATGLATRKRHDRPTHRTDTAGT